MPIDDVPPVRKRPGPAATKHVDILWAAAKLFGQRGIIRTSTRDIAAAAGTTERTLFKHFGSKDALVSAVISEAVVAHLAPTSLAALRRAIEAHGDDLATWHVALLRGRDQAMAQASGLTRLLAVELLRDEALRQRFAQEWLTAVWTPLAGLFDKLQREGRLRRDIPAAALARIFLSLNLGYLLGRHLLATDAGYEGAGEISAITRFFDRGASTA